MSHEFESGFVVRERAWHGLATVLQNPPSLKEGLVEAGLNWRVKMIPLYAERVGEEWIPVESHRAVVRESDQRVLGVVGSDYVPVQNEEAFAFFDALVSSGQVSLESAGSLKEGARVWVLAKMHRQELRSDWCGTNTVSDGDLIEPYLLVSNSHDGTRAVTVAFTTIRVVCWNTLSGAERRADSGKGASVRIRHVGRPAEALKQVSAFVDASRRTFALSLEEWRAMRSKAMQVDGLQRYVTKVLRGEDERAAVVAELEAVERALKRDQELASLTFSTPNAGERLALLERAGELRAKLEAKPRAFDEIERLFQEGPGAKLAGATVWGAFNAVTHWLDHERGRSAATRLDSSWFGVGATLREKARAEALALV